MFSLFENAFAKISELGTEGFTNGYLMFQMVLFLVMLGGIWHRMRNEKRVMASIKKELLTLERTSNPAELDKQLEVAFSKIKKSRYKELWSRYHNRVLDKNEDERIRIEPFLGFDTMYYHMGYRSWMDIGAGMSVSIGVLGTFIGLSIGLSDLGTGSGNTEALKTGIDSLLSGMKVAFYTSVWGVLLSLIWTIIDRFISQGMEKEIDWHSERLDYLLNTDDEELFLNRLEKISKNQADHLKTMLTDAMEKAMQPVVAQFQSLNQGMQTQAELLQTQLDFSKSNSTNMTEQLVNQITGGTEQTINQFGRLINDTNQMQEAMMGMLTDMVHKFTLSGELQANTAEQTGRIFQTFSKMSEQLENMSSHYHNTSGHMTELSETIQHVQKLTEQQLPMQRDIIQSNQMLAEKYDSLTDGFVHFNEKIEKKHHELLDNVVTMTSQLTVTYENIADRLKQALIVQEQSMKESAHLLDSIREVVSTLTPLAPELKEVVGNIANLKEQLNMMQELQNGLLPELVQLRTGTNKTVEEALHTTRGYMDKMSVQIAAMQENWLTTKEQFESTRNSLDLSLKDFSENIENGLSKTYQHFDQTLVNAVEHVTGFIGRFGDIQEDLIEGLDELAAVISRNGNVMKS